MEIPDQRQANNFINEQNYGWQGSNKTSKLKSVLPQELNENTHTSGTTAHEGPGLPDGDLYWRACKQAAVPSPFSSGFRYISALPTGSWVNTDFALTGIES